jgi:hypothetical protein
MGESFGSNVEPAVFIVQTRARIAANLQYCVLLYHSVTLSARQVGTRSAPPPHPPFSVRSGGQQQYRSVRSNTLSIGKFDYRLHVLGCLFEWRQVNRASANCVWSCLRIITWHKRNNVHVWTVHDVLNFDNCQTQDLRCFHCCATQYGDWTWLDWTVSSGGYPG